MKSVEFDVCEHNFDCWKFVNVWATFSLDISLFDVRALIPIWSVIHYFYMEPKGADVGCKKRGQFVEVQIMIWREVLAGIPAAGINLDSWTCPAH